MLLALRKITMSKQILIDDAVALRNIIQFAAETNSEAALGAALLRLLCHATSGMAENRDDNTSEWMAKPGDQICVISKDFAPHSLRFFGVYGTASNPKGWQRGPGFHNGGFIYDGPGQPLDGSAPALTVSIGDQPAKHSWGIHT